MHVTVTGIRLCMLLSRGTDCAVHNDFKAHTKQLHAQYAAPDATPRPRAVRRADGDIHPLGVSDVNQETRKGAAGKGHTAWLGSARPGGPRRAREALRL